MTFRRDPETVALHRKWKRFFADHTTALLAAGVPLWLEDAYEDWLDIVVYGYPEAARMGEPNWHKASDAELPHILNVLELYYGAGFPFHAPQFLQWSRPDEYSHFVTRYGSAE